MIERVPRSGVIVVVCAGAWLLLQGDWSFANLLWGVVLGTALAVAFPAHRSSLRHRLHPWGLIKLIGFVLWSLVLSSWAVRVIVPGVSVIALATSVAVSGDSSARRIRTIPAARFSGVGRRIVRTTAQLDPAELHVHGIGLSDLDDFRASVADLERRTVAALEPVSPEGGPP